MSQKITLRLKGDKFNDFITKINDLSNIDDTIKIKIDSEKIFMYSLLSNQSSILSLKNYTLNTLDYIIGYDYDWCSDFIVLSATKFVKNLKFFEDQQDIKLTLNLKDSVNDTTTKIVRSSNFQNQKIKITWIAGESHKIQDITLEKLKKRIDVGFTDWSFKLDSNDLITTKKLSQINNEDKFININVNGGDVTINEDNKWECKVDQINKDSARITFDKKYLNNITSEGDSIIFYIFDTFILIKGENWNLIFSFECNFE